MAEGDSEVQKLINYLEHVVDTDSKFDWEVFLSMLHTSKEIIIDSSRVPDLFDVTFDRLLRIGCEDKNTVHRILSICCSRRFSFNIRNNPICPVEMMDIAFKGVPDLMAVLVEYGLADGALKENAAEFQRARTTIVEFRSHAIEKDWLTVANNIKEFYANLNNMIEDMRNSCSQKSAFQRGARRFLLLARLLSVLQFKPSHEAQITCFTLFSKVLPDPFISLDELLEFLEIIFVPRMNMEGLRSIAEMYREYFPTEANSTYEPRSLKHLCRVSVRQKHRMRSKALRVSVKRMCIPETLKDFLVLDCEE